MDLLKKCTECEIFQPINNFRKKKKYKYGVYCYCKLCEKQFKKIDDKKYAQSKKGKIARRKAVKKYFQSKHGHSVILKARQNPKRKQKEKDYYNNKRKTDIIYRLKNNLRKRINIFLKLKNMKKSSKFNQYIGCTPQELKQYLESKFTNGMNWDNYGKWHIDHVIPLSSVKNEKKLYKLCHYINLQPLWAKDNLSKGNRG